MNVRQLTAGVFGIMLAVSITGCATTAPHPTVVKSEFIYEKAPFPECHASTIVETKSGLVAAWFGGTAERNPDVCIYVSRLEKGQWTPPMEVGNGVGFATNRLPTWNPVLFQPKHGPLMLFYKVGPKPAAWWGMMTASTDDGKTWATPHRLPDGILGPAKNKPVQLPNGGTLLCPSSTEGDGGWRVPLRAHRRSGENLDRNRASQRRQGNQGHPAEHLVSRPPKTPSHRSHR